jgi:hypothetical protein
LGSGQRDPDEQSGAASMKPGKPILAARKVLEVAVLRSEKMPAGMNHKFSSQTGKFSAAPKYVDFIAGEE